MLERRFVKGAGVTFRATPQGQEGLEGYAAVFNEEFVLYEDAGFRVSEIVKPGAFARALRENQDVRCLFNHNSDNVLGRTASGTLQLKEDQKGLHFDNSLDMRSHTANDVRVFVERRDVTGCSFAFMVTKSTWKEDQMGPMEMWVREIEDVDLFDVGPVTYPAYEGTTVNARAEFEQRSREALGDMPEKLRAKLSGRDAQQAEALALARARTRQAQISLGE
jgi:HK97 family phage prohead protease